MDNIKAKANSRLIFRKNSFSMENLAPIIVFAFNRSDSLARLIKSLLLNSEAAKSDLFLYVDGPRPGNKKDAKNVKEVRDYASTINGFRSVTLKFSECNKGLGPSLIRGITEIINKYGKAIVIEDDLQVTSNFLFYMNKGLCRYEYVERVFSICGYSNAVHPRKEYNFNTYFCTRSSSWGWATWKDRWNSIDWELNNLDGYHRQAGKFNKWGGSDCWHMLTDWKKGKNSSWAIRFCFAQFLQNKLSLFPIKSLVSYGGNDGRGTNSRKYSRMKFDIDTTQSKVFTYPDQVELNHTLYRQAMHYHSIPLRIWSRIMYILVG